VAVDLKEARGIITSFLERAEKSTDGVTDTTGLWGDGLELDSLEAAELSALLEDAFGTDPFSASDEMPETVGDILAFYEAAAPA
jgi:acyl carrier protein